MPGPRRKFRERPKKLGAKKRIRVKAHKKRLIDSGVPEEKLKKATDKEVREALKEKARPKKA